MNPVRRTMLEAMAASLEDWRVDPVVAETEVGFYSMSLQFSNGIRVAIGNDLDEPDSLFYVIRISQEMPYPLPFERAFEDGYAITEALTGQEVMALLGRYRSITSAAWVLH